MIQITMLQAALLLPFTAIGLWATVFLLLTKSQMDKALRSAVDALGEENASLRTLLASIRHYIPHSTEPEIQAHAAIEWALKGFPKEGHLL